MRAQDENLTRAILAAIDTQPGIRLAILFGSLAAGLERVDSNLDLAVDAGRRITAEEKLALMNELAQRTGRPVDSDMKPRRSAIPEPRISNLKLFVLKPVSSAKTPHTLGSAARPC